MSTKELTIDDVSSWKGSTKTFQLIYGQILDRFGLKAAKEYDPDTNCFTYKTWLFNGYQVRKGEKALKSTTWIKSKETDGKGKEKVFPKTVNLFFKSQVDKISE